MTAAAAPLERNCLVTVGATVGFKDLTQVVTEPDFWRFIRSEGFTSLRIQCGPDISWARDRRAKLQDQLPPGLDVVVFDVCKNLMAEEMVLCKAVKGRRAQGLVVSHAGTGTILDAWKLGLSIVVVPNTELLDNHQVEMAQHLAQEGYATMSSTNEEDLQGAIHKADLLREENQSRWPPTAINQQTTSKMSIWDIHPVEVQREEKAKMIHD